MPWLAPNQPNQCSGSRNTLNAKLKQLMAEFCMVRAWFCMKCFCRNPWEQFRYKPVVCVCGYVLAAWWGTEAAGGIGHCESDCVRVCGHVLAAWWRTEAAGGIGHCESDCVRVCGHVLATWWRTETAGGIGHCESDWREEPVQTAAGESANLSLHVSDVGRGDAASGLCTLIPSAKQRSLYSHCGQLSLYDHSEFTMIWHAFLHEINYHLTASCGCYRPFYWICRPYDHWPRDIWSFNYANS